MKPHPESAVILMAVGLACLLALGGRRAAWPPLVALLLALGLPWCIASFSGATEGAMLPPLLLQGLAITICYRLGFDGSRALRGQSRLLLFLIPALLAPVGLLVIGGAARRLLPFEFPDTVGSSALPFLAFAALLLLPDGSGIATATRRSGILNPLARIDALHATTALVVVPVAVVLLGLDFGAEPASWAPVGARCRDALGVIAIGLVAGIGVGRLLPRVPELPATGLLHAGLAILTAAVAELLASGMGPVAAVAAGLGAGLHRGPLLPARSASPIASTGLTFVVGATILAIAGVRCAPSLRISDLAGPILALAALAWLVRLLVLVSVAGLYRWFRARELSWRWILSASCLSFPGALPLVLCLLAQQARRGDASPFPPAYYGALTGVIALSLLFEGAGSVLLRRALPDLDRTRRWEHARGRRMAVRAGLAALEQLDREGDLDALSVPEREALFDRLRERAKVVELELEELNLRSRRQSDHPDAHAVRWIEEDLLEAAARALETAVRNHLITRASAEMLRGELSAWFPPDRPPAPLSVIDGDDDTP